MCVASGMSSASATITKACFPTVWRNCIEQAATPNIVKSAFRRSGIFPFDPSAVDSSQVSDNTWYVYNWPKFIVHMYINNT